MTNNILDKVIKSKEEKAKHEDLKICPNCKTPMIDNTFRHGSRLAGNFACSCGYKIRF